MSLGNIFEEADVIRTDYDFLISDLFELCDCSKKAGITTSEAIEALIQINKIMMPNEIRKSLGLEEIKCQ